MHGKVFTCSTNDRVLFEFLTEIDRSGISTLKCILGGKLTRFLVWLLFIHTFINVVRVGAIFRSFMIFLP